MKVGILTFTEGTNFGYILQNYALQYVLRDMGHEVYTIRQGPHMKKHSKVVNYLYRIAWNIRYKVRVIIKCLKDERSFKFYQFNKKYITFYKKFLPINTNNHWISKCFDVFVVGSDQVWNPYSSDVNSNYFLDFAEKNQRVTYAPSLACDRIPDSKIDEYKSLLREFDYITVREDNAVELITKLVDVDVNVVLDPTLLLKKNDWDNIKKESAMQPKGNYAIAIFLGDESNTRIEKICCELGKKMLWIDSKTKISPLEFISLIEHSDIVLTDSFHASVFAVIYEKPFINIDRVNAVHNMNSRFSTLYRIIGSTTRNWNYLKTARTEIYNLDYDDIAVRIDNLRNTSMQILEKSMVGADI